MRKLICNSRFRNRRFLSVLIIVMACALGSTSPFLRASVASGAKAADEAAMRENVRQMEAGWNTKSGALFAKPFAADADYIVVNGLHLRGRDSIQQGHQRIFDTIYKDSTLSLSAKQIRLLRPDVSVVHVLAHLKTRQGEATRESDAIITLVMTKEKGDWKIAAFQNTPVTGEGTPPAAQTR